MRRSLSDTALAEPSDRPSSKVAPAAAGHAPSPAAQSGAAAGHAAPVPDGAVVCDHVRPALFSHAAVHTDQLPWQSTFAGVGAHPPWFGWQSGATVGHAIPFANGGFNCVHVRWLPFSQAAVHSDQLPAQSCFTHAPPGVQSGAVAGQDFPAPDGAVDCTHVLAALFSHAAVHSDQLPWQSTSAGVDAAGMAQSSPNSCGVHPSDSKTTLLSWTHLLHCFACSATLASSTSAGARSCAHSLSNCSWHVDLGAMTSSLAATASIHPLCCAFGCARQALAASPIRVAISLL